MLSVKALYTEYPNEHGQVVKAAQNVSFEVPDGKLFTLLGPSGCGKTTTLRSIAGLEKPRSGDISVGGRVVYSSKNNTFIAPNKRNFGMVFQSYAIWPHMNVFQNAAFPLEVGNRKLDKKEIQEKVMRVLTVVGLDHLADREATKLSGGQQQRLALARALVMEPQLWLLDEPLSNLDAKLRERMRFELKRLQRELKLTTVYVTHDQSEALALSHEIAVMNEGQIIQIGSPREIYERPRNKFVADFVGTTNFISAKVKGRAERDGHYHLNTSFGPLIGYAVYALTTGEEITVSLRPEDIHVSVNRPDAENVWEGTVEAKIFLGEYLDFQIRMGAEVLQARVHPSLSAQVGSKVFLAMSAEKCVAIHDTAARAAS